MVSLRDIREYARAIAERFDPDKIILFGSYAYGKPTRDSDVDLMVLMRHPRGGDEGAIAIRTAIKTAFPKDILVQTSRQFAKRLKRGDYFAREIQEKGQVLYERQSQAVGGKGRRRLRGLQSRDAGAKKSEFRRRVLSRPTVRGKVSQGKA